VSHPSRDDIELEFYEQFLLSRGLEPYPVQERAFDHIFAGEGVLVTVPTGTGKTLIAKAALHKALRLGQTAVYTTPLRALTEEKYRELCADFGEDKVGFATGDFKVNRDAPIQVEVAEILWNRVFGDRGTAPADVVVIDEGHYFNDVSRGYVWEQTIIGLHPATQLVILSATIGHADQFCHWVELTRRAPFKLVESHTRTVPLEHRYEEAYLIEVVRDLAASGDYPAIIFTFGRERCFENARLLKSCRRFTSDEERDEIEQVIGPVLHEAGAAAELRPLLLHGIGIHHAGILPRYKQLVERLTLERLLKFVVSTETISAGINLPAKVVIFPELRKFIRRKARLLLPAEYHQMAGRAGRPQFDDKGLAIALAPEEVVQEIRKELKDGKKRGYKVDEEQVRKSVYARARADAQRRNTVVWARDTYDALVKGAPAALRSQTRITAEQVLAIGLPDLSVEQLPGEDVDLERAEARPAYDNLNIRTVVDHLLLPERERREAHKLLAHVTDNLRALDVIDEHGVQISGELIGQLPGVDGLFVYYCFMTRDLSYEDCRQLVEYLVDHDVIQRMLGRKEEEKRREWIRNHLRDMRIATGHATWEDAEAEYDKRFPPEPSAIELIHQEFASRLPHPELHGGKVHKSVWATMEDQDLSFFEFVDRHHLGHEEGSLFSYLTRALRVATSIFQVAGVDHFQTVAERIRATLVAVDPRLALPDE
jgi:hypothetical protein